MIVINMTKAREIKREQIRAQRVPLLASLDVEFMRAVESGDSAEQARIAAEKQRLRDAPDDPRIEAAQTPQELAALDLI